MRVLLLMCAFLACAMADGTTDSNTYFVNCSMHQWTQVCVKATARVRAVLAGTTVPARASQPSQHASMPPRLGCIVHAFS
jgi:hypothetical protein